MTTQSTPLGRRAKIIVISQAHLAPGMSLDQWQAILGRHGVIPSSKGHNGDPWRDIPDKTLDAILAEIAAVIECTTPDGGVSEGSPELGRRVEGQAQKDKEVQP